MTHALEETEEGIEIALPGGTREELFRQAVDAALAAAYGGVPEKGEYVGQVVPVQAVGETDREILEQLVRGCIEAAHESKGTLHAPRWLGFDVDRVTVTMPVTTPRTAPREVILRAVHGGPPFRLELELAAHH